MVSGEWLCEGRDKRPEPDGLLKAATLENRTQLFDNREVKGSESLRKVKAIAKRDSSVTAGTPNAALVATARFTSASDSPL